MRLLWALLLSSILLIGGCSLFGSSYSTPGGSTKVTETSVVDNNKHTTSTQVEVKQPDNPKSESGLRSDTRATKDATWG